jgi:polyisoprenoid-binding protein YceI
MKIALCVWACALSPVLAQEPPAAGVARYTIDAAHSTIAWELPATLHTVHGAVPDFSGSVELETGPQGEHVARGRVSVRAGNMRTGNDSRDKTMREKVLEVDRFPESCSSWIGPRSIGPVSRATGRSRRRSRAG